MQKQASFVRSKGMKHVVCAIAVSSLLTACAKKTTEPEDDKKGTDTLKTPVVLTSSALDTVMWTLGGYHLEAERLFWFTSRPKTFVVTEQGPTLPLFPRALRKISPFDASIEAWLPMAQLVLRASKARDSVTWNLSDSADGRVYRISNSTDSIAGLGMFRFRDSATFSWPVDTAMPQAGKALSLNRILLGSMGVAAALNGINYREYRMDSDGDGKLDASGSSLLKARTYARLSRNDTAMILVVDAIWNVKKPLDSLSAAGWNRRTDSVKVGSKMIALRNLIADDDESVISGVGDSSTGMDLKTVRVMSDGSKYMIECRQGRGLDGDMLRESDNEISEFAEAMVTAAGDTLWMREGKDGDNDQAYYDPSSKSKAIEVILRRANKNATWWQDSLVREIEGNKDVITKFVSRTVDAVPEINLEVKPRVGTSFVDGDSITLHAVIYPDPESVPASTLDSTVWKKTYLAGKLDNVADDSVRVIEKTEYRIDKSSLWWRAQPSTPLGVVDSGKVKKGVVSINETWSKAKGDNVLKAMITETRESSDQGKIESAFILAAGDTVKESVTVGADPTLTSRSIVGVSGRKTSKTKTGNFEDTVTFESPSAAGYVSVASKGELNAAGDAGQWTTLVKKASSADTLTVELGPKSHAETAGSPLTLSVTRAGMALHGKVLADSLLATQEFGGVTVKHRFAKSGLSRALAFTVTEKSTGDKLYEGSLVLGLDGIGVGSVVPYRNGAAQKAKNIRLRNDGVAEIEGKAAKP